MMHELRGSSRSRRGAWPTTRAALRAEVAELHAELVALRARELDERQPLGPRAGRGADGDQGERRPVRRAHAGDDGRLRPLRRRSSRATSRRRATRPRTATSTATCPDVGGVAHTHSPYATAFAARGEPIPCVLTAIADEFGGEIPVGPFARIGDDEIGRGIVETPRRITARPPC